MKEIILLGSTGSVGRNVLDVAARYPGKFRVKAMATGRNISRLVAQAEKFSPEIIAVWDRSLLEDLRKKAPRGVKVLGGAEAIKDLASEETSDMLFMAISGTASLGPLIAALERGKTVALASKEPIVSAGKIINEMVKKNSSVILPVDSEHSAILQCLSGRKNEDIEKIYITGTGGALHSRRKEELDHVSVDEVLAHPKWDMGRKITVDSATLMNKGLEVIEARWLFDIPSEKIKVVIHPEAMIHSMVEFTDGTVAASIFSPDMRFPILRALAYPDILPSDLPKVNFAETGSFTFSEPDRAKFPALDMAYDVLREGGTMPAVLNSANETAVKLFLDGKIKFTDIIRLVGKALAKHKKTDDPTLEAIIEAERWAQEEVLGFC
jgi:1-deoxy-D-xylulose-5-phosphate reductoisomerase